jgi:hypothetical protein
VLSPVSDVFETSDLPSPLALRRPHSPRFLFLRLA